VQRIGFLGSNEFGEPLVEALRQGLRDLGRLEGRDVAFDVRFQVGGSETLPSLAAELVSLRPAVIVTAGSEAALAAKEATDTVPIVIGSISDPVGLGLVDTLARPGGNITGLSTVAAGLVRKRVELLAQTSASIAHVGVAWYAGSPPAPTALREAQGAAEQLGIRSLLLEVHDPAGLDAALEANTGGQADALLVVGGPRMFTDRERIATLAAQKRLPSMYNREEWVEAGGVMSYGPSFAELYRRAATYVDKILLGAKPADLPVEQPTTLDFVINLKTARTLGLTVPQSVLQQATEVIQ